MAKKIIKTGAKVSVEFSVNSAVSVKWLEQFVEAAVANEMVKRNSPNTVDPMTASDIKASVIVVANEYSK